MKFKSFVSLFLFVLSSSLVLSENHSINKVDLKSQIDSVAYAIGVSFGQQLKKDEVDLNLEAFMQGMKDVLSDGKVVLSDEEMKQVMIAFQQNLAAKQQAKAAVQAKAEKEKGEKFLAENKKRKEVKTTASGLQYEVVKEGKGPKPSETSTVKVHYTGKLLDGTVFDSSVERGQPIEFPLNRVIKGWTEGLQLMPVGSKYVFYIPSDLAYGDAGAPPTIPPGATLIFEVELLDIVK